MNPESYPELEEEALGPKALQMGRKIWQITAKLGIFYLKVVLFLDRFFVIFNSIEV